MAVVTGLTVFASMVTIVVGTRGVRRISYMPKPATMTRFEGMRTLVSFRPFVVLMVVKVLQNVALAIMFTTLLLFFLNTLRIGYCRLINMAVVENVVICLSTPIWVRLGRQFGKRPAYLTATALPTLIYGSWFLARPGLPISNVWIRSGVSGFAAAGVILMSVSMIPDIMDYDCRLTGRWRDGVFASAFAIVEKLGFALGAGYLRPDPGICRLPADHRRAGLASAGFGDCCPLCQQLDGADVAVSWQWRRDVLLLPEREAVACHRTTAGLSGMSRAGCQSSGANSGPSRNSVTAAATRAGAACIIASPFSGIV